MSLNPEEKIAYIDEASAEVERTKVDPHAGGWETLFRQEQQQPQQQQQQQQQPQPEDKSSDQ